MNIAKVHIESCLSGRRYRFEKVTCRPDDWCSAMSVWLVPMKTNGILWHSSKKGCRFLILVYILCIQFFGELIHMIGVLHTQCKRGPSAGSKILPQKQRNSVVFIKHDELTNATSCRTVPLCLRKYWHRCGCGDRRRRSNEEFWGDESKPSNLGTFTGMNAKKKNKKKKKKTKEKKKKKHKMKHHHQLAETRV